MTLGLISGILLRSTPMGLLVGASHTPAVAIRFVDTLLGEMRNDALKVVPNFCSTTFNYQNHFFVGYLQVLYRASY